MNRIIAITLLLTFCSVQAAELPSWGMTEIQYKMPNMATKMEEIGNKQPNEIGC